MDRHRSAQTSKHIVSRRHVGHGRTWNVHRVCAQDVRAVEALQCANVLPNRGLNSRVVNNQELLIQLIELIAYMQYNQLNTSL